MLSPQSESSEETASQYVALLDVKEHLVCWVPGWSCSSFIISWARETVLFFWGILLIWWERSWQAERCGLYAKICT